jgi:hypothetical protein
VIKIIGAVSPGDMDAARCCNFECCQKFARCGLILNIVGNVRVAILFRVVFGVLHDQDFGCCKPIDDVMIVQKLLDSVEKAMDDLFESEGLQECLRLIVAIRNRVTLHSLLPEGAELNPLQSMKFKAKAAVAFNFDSLERVLGTRCLLEVGAKVSHFLVALYASPLPVFNVMPF